MLAGVKQDNPKEKFPEGCGQARDIVAEKSGFGSGKNFEKAKYISDNADDEMIKSLDEGGIETWKQYQNQKLKGYQIVS